MFEFCPKVSEDLKKPEFREYMIETAWDYYEVAHHGVSNKGYIQASLSCLAIEITLKCFNSDVSGNEGKINENYKPNKHIRSLGGKKSHDLIELLNLVDPKYIEYLFNERDIQTLEKNRNFFVSTRYGYEKDVPSVFYDSISKLAAATICKMVYLYKKMGSDDPFINNFDVNEVYFNNVQKAFLYSGQTI